MTNRQRYETVWNPLGTPVVYEKLGWRPSVERAVDGVVSALRRIGRGDGYEKRQAAFRRGWTLRRKLCEMWVEPASRVPWRIRQFLAEKIV